MRPRAVSLSLAGHALLLALLWRGAAVPAGLGPPETVAVTVIEEAPPPPAPPVPVAAPVPPPPVPAPARTAPPSRRPTVPAAATRVVATLPPPPESGGETATVPDAPALPPPPPPPAADLVQAYGARLWAVIAAQKPRHVRLAGTARISFQISAAGALLSAAVAASSGNPLLDRIALDTVTAAAPFPPPPPGSPDPLSFSIPFQFH